MLTTASQNRKVWAAVVVLLWSKISCTLQPLFCPLLLVPIENLSWVQCTVANPRDVQHLFSRCAKRTDMNSELCVFVFSKNLLSQAHLAAVFPRNKGRDWCIEGHLSRKVSPTIVFCLDPVMGAGKAALAPPQKFYLLFHPTGLWGKSLEESCSWFAVSQGSSWSLQSAACERQRRHVVSQASCCHHCAYLIPIILTNGCFSFILG